MTLKESARQAVAEVMDFWGKAGIPTSRSYDVEKCLINLHTEWQTLKKAVNRRTEKQVSNEEKFCGKLDKIFEIAQRPKNISQSLKTGTS